MLSPQLQEFTRPGAERQKLTFPILTDPDNQVGEAYGLAFRLPDDLIGVYTRTASIWHATMAIRAGGCRCLHASSFAVTASLASAEADPDYTHRPEPEATLAVLRGL